VSRFDVIDLASLPKPEVIEELSFEAILEELKVTFLDLNPTYEADILESDPAMKLLETAAYRELHYRQRENEKARAVMLAFASGNNLEHIAANYSVARRLLSPGNPDAVPPVPPVYEEDGPLKRRVQLSPEAMSVAGPRGGYIFNALSAGETPTDIQVETPAPGIVTMVYAFSADGIAANVKDADAFRSAPGDITVIVMSRNGSGIPDAATLAAVEAHLSDETVRPLNDTVFVLPVDIINYTIDAVLEITDGPEGPVILDAARKALQAYVEAQHRIGARVTDSGLKAAATVAGVEKVRINTPAGDIVPTRYQASWCTGITLTVEVVDD